KGAPHLGYPRPWRVAATIIDQLNRRVAWGWSPAARAAWKIPVASERMKANDMRQIILALALLYPAAVFAQTTPPPAAPANPPTAGDKPLGQVDSKKPKAAGKKAAAPPNPQPL